MRGLLKNRIYRTNDPALKASLDRNNPATLDDFMKQQRSRARKRKK
jgi:hypothetical protein